MDTPIFRDVRSKMQHKDFQPNIQPPKSSSPGISSIKKYYEDIEAAGLSGEDDMPVKKRNK